MRKYDKVFHGAQARDAKFDLANGYISTTEILFAEEGIVARVEAKGAVAFLDLEDRLIASLDIPAQTGGKEVYTRLYCSAEADTVRLKFPIVEWIDNYPNCDGEYDRWDSREIGCHIVTFCGQTGKITLEEDCAL